MMSQRKPIVLSLVLVIALLSGPASIAQQGGDAPVIVINEVQASNTETLADPQGQFDDWIELYNPGQASVDVGGMYLTDELDEPTKWQIPTDIPAQTTIASGGYLLIWADDDVDDDGLHASFRLSADGDTAALFDTDGLSLIDRLRFGEQTVDTSVGYYPDGQGEPRAMTTPTPGAANTIEFEGFVSDLKFSRTRGFYDVPFELTLTCDTPGVDIYYTRDGVDHYTLLIEGVESSS